MLHADSPRVPREGWSPGSSAITVEVPAGQVRAGDVVLLEDGREATVTDTRRGTFWMATGLGDGVAIGWKSGTASGVWFRLLDEAVPRPPRGR